MSDGFEKQNLAPTVPKTVEWLIFGDMYTSGGQESAQLSRMLDVLPSLCENAVNSGLDWSFSRWSDSSICSARMQGAMKTGPAPDESPISVRSDNTYIMGVTTPSDLELWVPEVNHISWIWFAWVNSCWHISRSLQAMDMRLAPLDTAKIEI